jgi:hypothetical protein
MLALRYGFSVALITLVVVPGGWAQQQTQQPQSAPQTQQDQNQSQPIPAYRSPLASAADSGSVQDNSAGAEQLVPDTRLPAGAQDLSLGAPKTGRSYWAPYFYLSSSAYSNAAAEGSGPGWGTWASISGGVNLRKISSNSDLTLTYLGGGSISSDGSNNSIVQQLGLAERVTFHRSAIAFMDQLGYLPQASFGYNGLGVGPLGSNGTLGLQPGFTPNQSILTATGQQITNTSLGEFDTFLTRRASFTFIGSYAISRFLNNNTLDNSNEATFQGGYNYQVTAKTTVAVFYRFDAFRYSNNTQSINDHSIQASYARRVVGKLAFQLSGGPDITISQAPISGSSTGATGKTTQFSWVANAILTYQLRRSQLQAAYSHGVTGGSGVLAGSINDQVSASASRGITPRLNAAWSVGYSRNTGPALAPTATSPAPTTTSPVLTPASSSGNQTYNYWFTGVNLTRTWGRSMNLILGYQVQYQDSSSAPCVTAPCSTSFVSHQISAGLGWNPRPTTIR